ncbi:hypothetical protein CRUP_015173 [Coryphaenoides rupestris]|nr:hypothetical protein CRUP_015173 [Coryphaenoides rupestris]
MEQNQKAPPIGQSEGGRHVFHRSCVDPWLLDHRTCPMCKMNILKALGIALNADCVDELPLDYDLVLGGPLGPLEAVVSGASSDGTLRELQPMASCASVASLVIAVETGLSDEEGSPGPSPLPDKS